MFLRLPASRQLGARVDGMVNTHELPINVVRTNKPKMLTGLSQKGTRPGMGVLPSPIADKTATGGQAGPTPSHGTYAERGKPVVLPPGRHVARHSRWGGGYRRMEEAKATR